MREAGDGLPLTEASYQVPEAVVCVGNEAPDSPDDRVIDFVDDPVIHQSQYLIREIVRRLCDEGQTEIPFAAPLRDLDELVGVAVAVEERLLTENHRGKHGAQAPKIQTVVVLLEIDQQLRALEVA